MKPLLTTDAERARKFFGKEFQSSQAEAISRTMNSWSWMLRRCFDPLDLGYSNYGGRGITVCDRWFVFSAFVEDMGLRPEDRTLDRISNDGDYEPANCRWATKAEQSRNRRNSRRSEFNGSQVLHVDIARSLGISEATVSRRAARGLSGDALSVPPNYKRTKLNHDQAREIKVLLRDGTSRASIAERFDISVQSVGSIARGNSWKEITC